MIFIGQPTGRYKGKTMICLVESKEQGFVLFCVGQKGHYRNDGTCVHTDEIMARVKPRKKKLVTVLPFGDRPWPEYTISVGDPK